MDQLYATEGYVESGYTVYTADAIALTASESSVVAVVGKLHDADIEQLTLFEIGVSANLTLRPPAYLESDTQMSAQVNYTGAAQSTLDNILNLSMQSDRLRDTASALSSNADVSAALSTIFDHTAQLSVEAVFECSASKIVNFNGSFIYFDYYEQGYFIDSSLLTGAQVTAIGGKVIEFEGSFIYTDYYEQGYFIDSSLLTGAQVTATATKVVNIDLLLNTSAHIDVTATAIKPAQCSIQVDTAQISTATAIKTITAIEQANFELTAELVQTKQGIADWTSAFSPTVIADLVMRGEVELEVLTTLQVQAIKVFDAQIDPIQVVATQQTAGLAVRISHMPYLRETIVSPQLGSDQRFGSAVLLSDNNSYWISAPGFLSNSGVVYQYNPARTIANPNTTVSNAQFGGLAIAETSTSIFTNWGVEATPTLGVVYQISKATGSVVRTYLRSSDGDRFGSAIAATDSILAVGTPRNSSNSYVAIYDLLNAGQFSAFVQTGDPLTRNFGAAVAFVGPNVVIGDPGYNSGRGRVYVASSVTGLITQVIDNPSTTNTDNFGSRLAALVDGTVVIGASTKAWPTTADTNAGIAYVYNINTNQFVYTLTNPSSSTTGDLFATDVAVNDNYIIVSASAEDIPQLDSGVVYVYSKATGQLLSTILNPNTPVATPNTAAGDTFGYRVSLNDSNWLLVSAINEDRNSFTSIGQAYLFEIVVEASEPIDVEVQTTLAAELTRAPYEFEIYAQANTTVQTDAVVTAQAQAQLAVAAQLVADVGKLIPAQAALAVTTQLEAQPLRIKPLSSQLDAVTNIVIETSKVKETAAELTVATELLAFAVEIVQLQMNIQANTDVDVLAGLLAVGSADLAVQTALLTDARLINITQTVWLIEPESRTWSIDTELRAWNIQRENRLHTI